MAFIWKLLRALLHIRFLLILLSLGVCMTCVEAQTLNCSNVFNLTADNTLMNDFTVTLSQLYYYSGLAITITFTRKPHANPADFKGIFFRTQKYNETLTDNLFGSYTSFPSLRATEISCPTMGGTILVFNEGFTNLANPFMVTWSTGSGVDRAAIIIGVVSDYPSFSGFTWTSDIYQAIPASILNISSGSGHWNSYIDIVCMVRGLPEPNISWYYGSSKLESGDKYSILPVNTGSILEYKQNLSIKNSGVADTNQTYRCVAENFLNGVPVVSDDTMISIYPLQITTISTPSPDVTGRKNELFEISCTFGSYPQPVVEWTKSGQVLSSSGDINISSYVTNIHHPDYGVIVNSTLRFATLTTGDIGNYTCQAKQEGLITAPIRFYFSLEIISQPVITSITDGSIQQIGTELNLTCAASGSPNPSLSWLNSENTEISASSQVTVTVTESGDNLWTCVASSTGGYTTSTITVIGYRTPAQITTPPSNVTANFNEQVVFECEHIGHPTPVLTWTYFNPYLGTEFNIEDSLPYRISANGSLYIGRVSYEDQGNYRCNVSNIGGSMSATASLSLVLTDFNVIITPGSQLIHYNQTITISCSSQFGNPIPLFRIRTPTREISSSTLIISEFTESDVGEYACIGTSPANGNVRAATATYNLYPLTVNVTPPQVHTNGVDIFTLTCQISGYPNVDVSTIRWYLLSPCYHVSTEVLSTMIGYTVNNDILTIDPSNVRTSLSGDYICEIQRFGEIFRGNATVTKEVGSDNLSISSFMSYTCPYLEGSLTITLSCDGTSSEGNSISYSWFRNTEQLVLLPTDYDNDLDQYGTYRCIAETAYICNYTVEDIEGGLTLNGHPQSQTVNVGDRAVFQCDIIGEPEVAYKWFKNSTLILSQTKMYYEIPVVTELDAGSYSCEANLPSCSAIPSILSNPASLVVTSSAPSVPTAPQTILVNYGDNFTLQCSVIGLPPPSIQWYYNSFRLIGHTSSQLNLSDLQLPQSGVYTCEAYSYVGRNFQDIVTLTVYSAAVSDIRIAASHVLCGGQVTLTCYAYGVPTPTFEWFNSTGAKISSYYIAVVTYSGEDSYTCTATNAFSSESLTHQLTTSCDPLQNRLLVTILIPIMLTVLLLSIIVVIIILACILIRCRGKRYKEEEKEEVARDTSKVQLREEPLLVINEDTMLLASHEDAASLSSVESGESVIESGIPKSAESAPKGGLEKSKLLTLDEMTSLLEKVKNEQGLDNELVNEFESTPSNMQKSGIFSKENDVKNRYMNVLPNEETMVTLINTGDPNSTYMNANFIADYQNSKSKTYIATQGPLPSTLADFWRMVWENDVIAIVMTCQLLERKRLRCARYWPELRHRPSEIYGTFKVTTEAFTTHEHYEASILHLSNLKAGPKDPIKKQIYHFWYKAWPPFGVPSSSEPIRNFLAEMNKKIGVKTRKPIVFHCSAGIGRTAVFIGLDMGMKEFQASNKVNPVKYLGLMRKGRGGSVQTTEQYMFLHEALHEYMKEQVPKTVI